MPYLAYFFGGGLPLYSDAVSVFDCNSWLDLKFFQAQIVEEVHYAFDFKTFVCTIFPKLKIQQKDVYSTNSSMKDMIQNV